MSPAAVGQRAQMKQYDGRALAGGDATPLLTILDQIKHERVTDV